MRSIKFCLYNSSSGFFFVCKFLLILVYCFSEFIIFFSELVSSLLLRLILFLVPYVPQQFFSSLFSSSSFLINSIDQYRVQYPFSLESKKQKDSRIILLHFTTHHNQIGQPWKALGYTSELFLNFAFQKVSFRASVEDLKILWTYAHCGVQCTVLRKLVTIAYSCNN